MEITDLRTRPPIEANGTQVREAIDALANVKASTKATLIVKDAVNGQTNIKVT